ncbi:MAG: ATP-binding protein, partial [Candidatus Coproplasma sp.]
GRMLEDIVLLETKLANPNKRVFKLQFSNGEFDMVVFDPINGGAEIYEIKYSQEADTHQVRHLIDEEKCTKTQYRFGTITKKAVLYRGASKTIDGIQYQNVEEYLKSL